MTVGMTVKEALKRRIDEMSDEDAAELLAELEWQETDEEVLTPEEEAALRAGKADFAAGDWEDAEELFQARGL